MVICTFANPTHIQKEQGGNVCAGVDRFIETSVSALRETQERRIELANGRAERAELHHEPDRS